MTQNTGIRLQILLTIILIVATGFSLLMMVVTPVISSALTDEQLNRSQWLAGALSAELARQSDDHSQGVALLEQWNKSLGSTCVALWGSNGLVAPGKKRLETCVGPRSLKDIESLTPGQHKILGEGDASVLVVVTSVSESWVALGEGVRHRLVLVTPLRTVAERTALSRQLIMLFMLLLVALVTLAGYAVLTVLIVRPTSRLMRSMERVKSGDLNASVTPTGSKELRSLATTFNDLTQKLASDEARITRQISELRYINEKLETATGNLVRSEKMASVGKLAAGVAHEIGNPVSIVMGYLEMLKRSDASEPEKEQWLAETTDAMQRVDAIIRDLLDFSRREPNDEEARADVCAVVGSTLKLLQPQKSLQSLNVVTTFAEEAPIAQIAESRLQQVLINLIMNAAHALQATSDGEIVLEVDCNETRVCIHVMDNGPGISQQDHSQLFDPFFTTKEPGEGTGLGLSICYNILDLYGGEIRCVSTEGSGAKFTVDLPRLGGINGATNASD